MSFTAAALKLLADRGLTAHEIAEIAAANETPVISAYEKRKAYDRQRKAEKRAENKSGGMSGGNPPDPAPNEIDILTPTRETKTEPKGSSKSPVQREKLAAIGTCLKAAYPAPMGVTEEVWIDFLQSPKRCKAGMSKTAYAGICNNLTELAEHGFPPGEMLALAVERGWVTVKLEWVLNDNGKRTNSMGRHQPADGLSATARAALDVFGS
jgi:hypothetical protein